MVDVTLDNAGYVCPEKTGKIALIDADTIVFASCSVLHQVDELLAREMYTDEEWDDVIACDGYDADAHVVKFIPIDEAYAHSMDKIQSILDRTGCIDFELHFTRGRKSFPYTMVSADYKGNRTMEDVPYGLSLMKDEFVKRHPDKAFNNFKVEADHIVVCKKRDFPEKYTLASVDKDVYLALEGRHFNYYSSTKWKIPMKWVDVTADGAMRRYYIQTIMGDDGDNVIGLHGIGPKKAAKALVNCHTPAECWVGVVNMYTTHGRDIVDAITNFRLVDMRQLVLNPICDLTKPITEDDYQVKLWDPRDL